MIMASKVVNRVLLMAELKKKLIFMKIEYKSDTEEYIVQTLDMNANPETRGSFIINLSKTFMDITATAHMITVMVTASLTDRFKVEEIKECLLKEIHEFE